MSVKKVCAQLINCVFVSDILVATQTDWSLS